MNKDNFNNPETINIFCDASIINKGNTFDGCYGAIAVYNNRIINEICRITTDTTNNNAEIKAVRAAVSLALLYQHKIPTINIFSDSQISVLGIRDRIYTWKLKGNQLYGTSDQPIKSQEIFIEVARMITENHLDINIWHQKGHVKNSYDSLVNAQHVFAASNRIRETVDLDLIRYISNYNNKIDQKTRSILYDRSSIIKYKEPIVFSNYGFYELINQYKQIIGGKSNV